MTTTMCPGVGKRPTAPPEPIRDFTCYGPVERHAILTCPECGYRASTGQPIASAVMPGHIQRDDTLGVRS